MYSEHDDFVVSIPFELLLKEKLYRLKFIEKQVEVILKEIDEAKCQFSLSCD